MRTLPESLAKWREYDQFILLDGKVPTNIYLKPTNAHDPANWMSSQVAMTSAEMLKLGVGFVFTKDDPFCGIDLNTPMIFFLCPTNVDFVNSSFTMQGNEAGVP